MRLGVRQDQPPGPHPGTPWETLRGRLSPNPAMREEKSVMEEWKDRILRWLAGFCLRTSTYEARKRLGGSGPLKILVDNSVLGHGRTHETVGVRKTIPWPPGAPPSEISVIRRAPIDIEDRYGRKTYENVQFLPGIAYLARLGLIELVTSQELISERDRQPSGRFRGDIGWLDCWLFKDIEIPSVDGYGDLSKVFERVKDGPKKINKIISSTEIDPLGMFPNNKEKQLRRISKSTDPLYLELARALPKRSNLDAWHIRTAEVHGLFCFLTMDLKLYRVFRQNQNKEPFSSLETEVITPKGLGELVGFRAVDPHVLGVITEEQ